jgi:hypothetical protein
VARTHTSRRCSARTAVFALLALATASCGGRGWETATELPKTPRHPDGVALDPPPAMPTPTDQADARGVVALREPLADKDVEDVVRAYLRAFEREDAPALEQLLAQEAVVLGRPGTTRQQLFETWRAKIKNFDYQRLAGAEIARISQIERYSYETLGGAGPQRPLEMRPGDLYVRVPIATPRVGSEQLFGDVLVLLLRREEGRLKIAGQADENGS